MSVFDIMIPNSSISLEFKLLAPKAGLEPATFNQLLKTLDFFACDGLFGLALPLSYLGRLPADNPQSAEGILGYAYVSAYVSVISAGAVLPSCGFLKVKEYFPPVPFVAVITRQR